MIAAMLKTFRHQVLDRGKITLFGFAHREPGISGIDGRKLGMRYLHRQIDQGFAHGGEALTVVLR